MEIPPGTEAGKPNELVGGVGRGACTTLELFDVGFAIAELSISAMAGAAVLAGMAYDETRPALAMLIPMAFP